MGSEVYKSGDIRVQIISRANRNLQKRKEENQIGEEKMKG